MDQRRGFGMNVVFELYEWNLHWRLGSGLVHCRQCGTVQREDHRDEAFTHAEGCRYQGDQLHPWKALDDACGRIKGGAYIND